MFEKKLSWIENIHLNKELASTKASTFCDFFSFKFMVWRQKTYHGPYNDFIKICLHYIRHRAVRDVKKTWLFVDKKVVK